MTAAELHTNARAVRRIFDDCFDRGRLGLLSELVAADFQDAQGGVGPDAFRRTDESIRTRIPDIHYTLEDVLAAGDKVTVRWTWTGTNTGPMRGRPPSGRRVTNTGIAIFQLRGGKITRVWMETDRLGYLQQTGVVPESVTATPPQPAAVQ